MTFDPNSAPDLEVAEDPVMAQEVAGIDRLEARENRAAALAEKATAEQAAREAGEQAAAVAEATAKDKVETDAKIAAALAELRKTMQKNAPDSLDFT